MPVIRVKRRENPYVQLMRETIRLRDLSLKATGLWTLAMSYPDDWEFNYEHLTKQKTDGEYAFKTAFKELESAGLAALETVRNNDGTLDGKRWTIYEDSSDNPKTTSSVPTDSAVFRPSEKSDVGEITDYGIKNKEDVFTKRISDGETRAREDPVQILRDAWHVRPSPYQQEKITAVVKDLERWRQLVERFALEAKTQKRCIAWIINDYLNPKPQTNGSEKPNTDDVASNWKRIREATSRAFGD